MTTRPMQAGRLFNFICLAMLAITLGVGGLRALRASYVVFRHPQPQVVRPELARQAEAVKRMLPAGAAVFYLSREREYWNSRFWQRALYPRPVFLILGADEAQEVEFKQLKEKYRVRYAISAGPPPPDLGFAWQTALHPAPDKTDSVVFGELKP